MKETGKEHSQEEKQFLTEDEKLVVREHHINQLNKEAKNNMMARTIMACCLVAFTLPCLVIGGWAWIFYIFVLAIIITHEIIRAPQSIEKKFNKLIYVFSYIMILLIIFGWFAWDMLKYLYHNGIDSFWSYDITDIFYEPQIPLVPYVVVVFFVFLEVFFDKNFTIFDAFYFISIIFIVSLGLQCLIYLRFLPYNFGINLDGFTQQELDYGITMLPLLYCLVGICLNDVGAYIFGILFGKKKMCPNISPKKTWGGFIGGFVASFVPSFALGMILSACNIPILDSILDLNHWYNILVLSLIMPIASTFGDLLFSSIKRGYHIKDFGTILKSHGGILDRFDSIIVTSILVSTILYVMIRFPL